MRGRAACSRQRSAPNVRRLSIQQLESRQLLASQILGTVWHDANIDGLRDANELGLPGWEVFLDSNHNGVHDEHVQTASSSSPPLPIIDLTTITSTLHVSGMTSRIVDVAVTLTINHTYDADLHVSLISPRGTRVQLFADVGGRGDGFANTTFDDHASIPIAAAGAPFAGRFRPAEPLSAFRGEDANGNWTLEITDDANRDVGELVRWSLTIRGAGEPKAVTDANGDYLFDQLGAGDYTVRQILQDQWSPAFPVGDGSHCITLGVDEVLPNIDFGNNSSRGEIRGTVWNDTNHDGVRQSGESGLAGWTVYLDQNHNGGVDSASQSIHSSDVPIPIADLATVVSTIDIRQQSGVVEDVNVRLTIDHTYNADLDVFLISPGGTRVELFSDVGGSGDGFFDTTIDDEATRPISSGSGPWSGSFRPEGLLATLDGEVVNGTWRLEITDDAGRDTGRLVAWSLDISGTGESAVVTDSNGAYRFVDLNAGDYRVRQMLEPGWETTSPVGSAPQQVTLPNGQIAANVDFGNVLELSLGEIHGTVWNDANGDGVRQSGESGLPDWSVYLDLSNNRVLDPVYLTVESPNVPLDIFDQTTVISTLDVSGFTDPIDDVNVTLSLGHTYNDDLDVFLISPTGTRVELFTDVGGASDGFFSTTLDDEASSPITTASFPFTGTFRPEGLLSDFNGQFANGTWTLEIADDQSRDTGQLLNWSLNISAAGGEPVVTTDSQGDYAFTGLADGSYRVRQVLPAGWLPAYPGDGDGYQLQLSAGQQMTHISFGNLFSSMELSGVVWIDSNADGIRDAGEDGVGNRAIYIDENNNGQLDQEILNVGSGHIDLPITDLSTVTSELVVSDFGSPITDVNVSLFIEHTYDADLEAFIISPSGTRVELFTDVGGSGQNFFNTTLDDQTDFAITTAVAPFVWSFQPEGTLADFHGEDANGIWKLEITDDARRDVGELHDWSLQITGAGELITFTDSEGNYAFSNLTPDVYTLRQILPPLWQETLPATGEHAVEVQLGSVAEGLDFGSYNTQPTYQLLPDLTVLADERRNYLYDAVLERSGGTTLLRFTTATANIGEGTAQLVGSDINPAGMQNVLQRIYDTDGGFTDRLAGEFLYHPQHNHIHFDGYADYHLRAVTPGGGVGEVVAAAEKISFCLVDSAPYDLSLPGAPATAQFTSCGAVSQGISVGWVDVYGDHLPDQTIDVTGLPAGTYWLENVVDPENAILELDETNNTTRILIELDVAAGTVTPVRGSASTTGTISPLEAAAGNIPSDTEDSASGVDHDSGSHDLDDTDSDSAIDGFTNRGVSGGDASTSAMPTHADDREEVTAADVLFTDLGGAGTEGESQARYTRSNLSAFSLYFQRLGLRRY